LTAKHLFELAREANPWAQQVVSRTASLIGLGVANIVSLVNPEIVILGGSVGAQGDLLLDQVKEVVRHWAQPASASSVVITSSQLGADAGLLGAAYAALLRAKAH
jgi:glucokinase